MAVERESHTPPCEVAGTGCHLAHPDRLVVTCNTSQLQAQPKFRPLTGRKTGTNPRVTKTADRPGKLTAKFQKTGHTDGLRSTREGESKAYRKLAPERPAEMICRRTPIAAGEDFRLVGAPSTGGDAGGEVCTGSFAAGEVAEADLGPARRPEERRLRSNRSIEFLSFGFGRNALFSPFFFFSKPSDLVPSVGRRERNKY